jgi:hypothetical protein
VGDYRLAPAVRAPRDAHNLRLHKMSLLRPLAALAEATAARGAPLARAVATQAAAAVPPAAAPPPPAPAADNGANSAAGAARVKGKNAFKRCVAARRSVGYGGWAVTTTTSTVGLRVAAVRGLRAGASHRRSADPPWVGAHFRRTLARPRPNAPPESRSASSVMADITREAAVRMQQKMLYFRPPMPAFRVGDAIEIQVRRHGGGGSGGGCSSGRRRRRWAPCRANTQVSRVG